MKKKRKKKSWFNSVVYLLVCTLMFTSMPLTVLAETAPPPPVVDQKQTPVLFEPSELESSYQKQARTENKQIEVPEKRTETEKVFANPDGTFTKKIFMHPVHKEKNGKWVDISSEVVEKSTTQLTTEETELDVTFQKDVKKKNNNEYAQFEVEGHTLTFSVLEANGDDGKKLRLHLKETKHGIKESFLIPISV